MRSPADDPELGEIRIQVLSVVPDEIPQRPHPGLRFELSAQQSLDKAARGLGCFPGTRRALVLATGRTDASGVAMVRLPIESTPCSAEGTPLLYARVVEPGYQQVVDLARTAPRNQADCQIRSCQAPLARVVVHRIARQRCGSVWARVQAQDGT